MSFILVFLYVVLFSLCLKVAESNQVCESEFCDVDEDILFAKYQNLISASLEGRDLSFENGDDFLDGEATLSGDNAEETEEFLRRMSEIEQSAQLLDDTRLTSDKTGDEIDTFLPPDTLASNSKEGLHEELEISENITNSKEYTSDHMDSIVIDQHIADIDSETESVDNGLLIEEAKIDDVVVDSFSNHDENITFMATIANLKNETQLIDQLEGPIYRSKILSRIASLDLGTSGLLALESILLEFETRWQSVHHCCDSLSEKENCSVLCGDESISKFFDGLTLVNRNDMNLALLTSMSSIASNNLEDIFSDIASKLDHLSTLQQEFSSCKEHLEMTEGQQSRSDQQRELLDIRLKKCKNDISILKLSGEQQSLLVEESKLDLEFRLKEMQRENARLRVTVEDLKRKKISLHDRIDPVPNIQGNPQEHTLPELSPAKADASLHMESAEVSILRGEKVLQPTVSGYSVENELLGLPADRHKTQTWLVQTTGVLHWFKHYCLVYLLSFVVWEYRIMYVVLSSLANRVDPRLVTWIQTSVLAPIRLRYVEVVEGVREDLAKYSDLFPFFHPLASYASSILTWGDSRWQRYANIIVGSRQIHNSAVDAEIPSPSFHVELIDSIVNDLSSLFSDAVVTVSSTNYVRYLFGVNANVVGLWITVASCLLLLVFFRRLFFGLLVLAALIIFSPILLTLLAGSYVMSIFLPKRKKVVRKRRDKKQIIASAQDET